jgi:hypothetical protein
MNVEICHGFNAHRSSRKKTAFDWPARLHKRQPVQWQCLDRKTNHRANHASHLDLP